MKLSDYTLVNLEETTHLVVPYARETLCGLPKIYKPTVWVGDAWGTGCEDCQAVAITKLTEAFVKEALKFDRFVNDLVTV